MIANRRSLSGSICAIAAVALAFALPCVARAQANQMSRDMNKPVAPFHMIGNIYYVGASDITSYLIVTPSGDILLDGGFAETAPQIEANIQTLSYKLAGVKIILNSHEHLDHAGGIAELRRLTGAQFVAMAEEVPTLTSGAAFPAVTPDRIIHDSDTIRLGGVTLTAHLTPGHTRGCTTWTMVTTDAGKPYNVVFVGSASVLPNYKLIDRPGAPATYPGIEADYEKTFRVLKSLPCDVFLGAHGSFYSLVQKREAMSKDPAQNPFIDPAGYQAYIAHAEAVFQAELQRERSG
ncbi:MAG TPA: subclass B3 metallo-beta-lactamase [Candidatus Acidoferrales bacterium]|jgi:metallo-beta-lactamase class B|nr:subclass B3 metallo-beta-lactamase [Candidatus Acidoferrales bacterium]